MTDSIAISLQTPSAQIEKAESNVSTDFSSYDALKLTKNRAFYGVGIACLIVGLWGISLAVLLVLDITKFPAWLMAIAALWQTFLYTGLFITAHDAMHGSVCPQNLKLNHWIGSLCTCLYGIFFYQELLKKHHLHHRYPASDRDPDYHDGFHADPVSWYVHFMMHYGSWKQSFAFILIFCFSWLVLGFSASNLVIFWGIPALLSSIQLFYFGTFLTHRESITGYCSSLRTRSNPLPVLWSFVTCYHFGYHEEHHKYPQTPWWGLPQVYKMEREYACNSIAKGDE